MANTTPRAIRIPDELWSRALATAHNTGTTVTDIVIQALSEFVAGREVQELDELDTP